MKPLLSMFSSFFISMMVLEQLGRFGFVLGQASYYVEKESALQNQALAAEYVFQTSSEPTAAGCFALCLTQCRCMTFQVCNGTECQLLASNRFLNQSALKEKIGCTYYDMLRRPVPQGGSQTCNQAIDCCRRSNPCLNGGTCRPSPATDNSTRFQCLCPGDFYGERCEFSAPVSCRGYNAKKMHPGKYSLRNTSLDSFETFCDFDYNASMAWTLIQSFELQARKLFDTQFYVDSPVNPDTPSWDSFRLPLAAMQRITQDSIKWRATCNYETDGVVYTDYAVAFLSDVNILNWDNRRCAKYEYINIRGQNCSNCTAHTRQVRTGLHVNTNHTHGDRCDFFPTGSEVCTNVYNPTEDNFGHYKCNNPTHRCTASATSTTQIWVGGKLNFLFN